MTEPKLEIPLRIEDTLAGSAVGCDGPTLSAISPKAFPPGRPLVLHLASAAGELRLETRTISSKKRDDGRFDLRVRFTNLRKEARTQLDALFGVTS